MRLSDTDVRKVLDAITRPFGYQWSIEGHAVNVTHRGAMVGKRNLLNARISTFTVPETALGEADCRLRVAFYFASHPGSKGVLGDCLFGAINVRVGPLEIKNATVRQILNRMVSQHGNGAWIVQQPPWMMGKDLGYGLWKVLPYDSPDGNYSKRLLVRGLGLQR